MTVVTLSGSLGSGARDVAMLAAAELGLDYVDREILVEAAGALGVSVDAVQFLDERASSFGERLAAVLRRVLERSAAASAADPMMGSGGLELLLGRTYSEAAALPHDEPQELDDRRYIETLTIVIRSLAERGNVLILGRGSQVILRDWPGSLHVACVAPTDWRAEVVAQRDGLSLEEARRRVHDGDRGRAAFHRRYFKVDVNDPCLYDLVIRTDRIPGETAAELVSVAARRRERGSGREPPVEQA